MICADVRMRASSMRLGTRPGRPASQPLRNAACSLPRTRAGPICSAAAQPGQPPQAEPAPAQPPPHQPDNKLFARCLGYVQNHWRVVAIGIYIVPCIIWWNRAWVCHGQAVLCMLPVDIHSSWTDTQQCMLLFRFASCCQQLLMGTACMMSLPHLQC